MPAISMFFGIVIRMFAGDHNPPHFHATYQEHEARFDFEGCLIDGDMPSRQVKLIAAWAAIHYDELVANWTLGSRMEPMFKIAPLR